MKKEEFKLRKEMSLFDRHRMTKFGEQSEYTDKNRVKFPQLIRLREWYVKIIPIKTFAEIECNCHA